jgi:hypothetical protein
MGTLLPAEANSLMPCSRINTIISYQFSMYRNVLGLTVLVWNEGRSVFPGYSFWSRKIARKNQRLIRCSRKCPLLYNWRTYFCVLETPPFDLIINQIYWMHNFTCHWHIVLTPSSQLRMLFPKCFLIWMREYHSLFVSRLPYAYVLPNIHIHGTC